MVLSPGGPPVAGGWYWTTSRATTASNWGSLIWWKDNADAVFPGVGEVTRGAWRNGSSMPCGTPCLRAFSVELPGYTQVNCSIGGSPFSSATQVAGDHWTFETLQGGNKFRLDTNFGLDVPSCQGTHVTNENDGTVCDVNPVSLDSVNHIYTYQRPDDLPKNWPGSAVQWQLVHPTPPPFAFRQHAITTARTSPGITLAWPVPTLPGSLLVAFLLQFGSDNSGGSPVNTPPPAGFTAKYRGTTSEVQIYSGLFPAAQLSVTIDPDGAADLQTFYIAEFQSPPAGYTDGAESFEGNAGSADMNNNLSLSMPQGGFIISGWQLRRSGGHLQQEATITPIVPGPSFCVASQDIVSDIVTGGKETQSVTLGYQATPVGSTTTNWHATTDHTLVWNWPVYVLRHP